MPSNDTNSTTQIDAANELAVGPVIEVKGVLIFTKDLLYIRPLDRSIVVGWATKELHIPSDSFQNSCAIVMTISERMNW